MAATAAAAVFDSIIPIATTAISTASRNAPAADYLPRKLIRFFAKYPPRQFSAYYTGVRMPLEKYTPDEIEAYRAAKVAAKAAAKGRPEIPTPVSIESQTAVAASTVSSTVPPASTLPSDDTPSSNTILDSSEPEALETIATGLHNPFLPWKNPLTGCWRPPVYGLRRQADLVKEAKRFGVEPLLPPGRKSTEFKEERLLKRGLMIRGTGEGQVVKGHKWERSVDATVEKRVKAMEEMPELIREWKSRGHGRWWKKFPK